MSQELGLGWARVMRRVRKRAVTEEDAENGGFVACRWDEALESGIFHHLMAN